MCVEIRKLRRGSCPACSPGSQASRTCSLHRRKEACLWSESSFAEWQEVVKMSGGKGGWGGGRGCCLLIPGDLLNQEMPLALRLLLPGLLAHQPAAEFTSQAASMLISQRRADVNPPPQLSESVMCLRDLMAWNPARFTQSRRFEDHSALDHRSPSFPEPTNLTWLHRCQNRDPESLGHKLNMQQLSAVVILATFRSFSTDWAGIGGGRSDFPSQTNFRTHLE